MSFIVSSFSHFAIFTRTNYYTQISCAIVDWKTTKPDPLDGGLLLIDQNLTVHSSFKNVHRH